MAKILIVDDDAETLRLVALMLERQGFDALTASNGAEGLQLARNRKPDIIVLDVMMPFMDGYAVTRAIRQSAETADIPILAFTARTHLEDKVAAYDAGVDDYLTKPVHPSELVSRINALLARRRTKVEPSAHPGYLLGVLAARGGLGVSTLALELAITLYRKTRAEVIAAELRLAQASWALQLGLNNPGGLPALLRQSPAALTAAEVEKQLVRTNFGPRLLLSSSYLSDLNLINQKEELKTLVQALPRLARFVILDVGTPYLPGFEHILACCDELLIITEGNPETVHRTHQLMDELQELPAGKGKLVNLTVNNRQRSDLQLTVEQVKDQLGIIPLTSLPPVPELAYSAAVRKLPMSLLQPEGIIARQIDQVAEYYQHRIPV